MDALEVIGREGARFYEVAAAADPGEPVESCPGWSIADLVWHLGEVHWFWATIVERRLQRPDEAERDKPPRPDDAAGLVAFGRSSLDQLLTVLGQTPDDAPVWTWADQHDVGFIRRHQVQETCIHRWDLQRAAGGPVPDPIEPAAAVDAIDEFLSVSLPWIVNAEQPLPGSVHLHCTDAPGEWFVHPDGRVEPIHAKGDVAVRAGASDLLLALYRRVSVDDLELIGDRPLGVRLFEAIEVG